MRKISNNPINGNARLQGACILMAIGANILFLNNAKQTPYHIATVKTTNKAGEEIVRSAIMYDTNYQKGGFKVGDSLLLRAEQTPGYDGPLLVVSNLAAADRAKADDFDFGGEVDATPAAQTPAAPKIRETVGEDA